MLSQLPIAIASGVTIGMILNMFYKVINHAWPQNYFGLTGTLDPIISRNLARWAIFRLVPPGIAAAAATLTAERAGASAFLAVAIGAAVHLLRLIRGIAVSMLRRYWGAALGQSFIVIAVGSTMSIFSANRTFFDALVPRPSELVANIWAGLLAAIGAVYLQQSLLRRRDPHEIARKSFQEISHELKYYAYQRALSVGIDPRIPLAIMCCENMQRPQWVRRIESLIPRRLNSTRGIMQQVGASTDKDSIDLAIARHLHQYQDWRGAFEAYNSDPVFVGIATGAYQLLCTNSDLITQIVDEGSLGE